MASFINVTILFHDKKWEIQAQENWNYYDVRTYLETSGNFQKDDFVKKYQLIRPGIAWEKWLPETNITLSQASSINKVERESSFMGKRQGPFELIVVETDSLIVFIHEKSKTKSFILAFEDVPKTINDFTDTIQETLKKDIMQEENHERWLNLQKPKRDYFKQYHYWMESKDGEIFMKYQNHNVDPHFLTTLVVHMEKRFIWTQYWPYQFSIWLFIFLCSLLIGIQWKWSNCNIQEMGWDISMYYELFQSVFLIKLNEMQAIGHDLFLIVQGK